MQDKQIQCPNCGNLKTNEVSWSHNYCMKCDIEFNVRTKDIFEIQYDGSLIKHNEFMCCG